MLKIEVISGQNSFEGSFLMTFEDSGLVDEPPLTWNIMLPANGGKLVFRVEDEMRKKGVLKRVLFDPADSTWTMTIGYNQIKQGTRIHSGKMFVDTTKHPDFRIKKTNNEKLIEGFRCRKIILESNTYKADAWVTKEFNFDLCTMYRLLCHCGMMNEQLRKSDWYLFKNIEGMIIEINSIDKQSGKKQSLKISNINRRQVDATMFDLEGYKIADIPEGQNCGPVIK